MPKTILNTFSSIEKKYWMGRGKIAIITRMKSIIPLKPMWRNRCVVTQILNQKHSNNNIPMAIIQGLMMLEKYWGDAISQTNIAVMPEKNNRYNEI